MDSLPDSTTNRARWPHYAIVVLVFSITGLVAVLISRLLINGLLEIRGDLWSGPWSYRAAYLLLIPPSYSVTLVAVGTLFGKGEYFKKRVLATWSRLLPKAVYDRSPPNENGSQR